MVPGASYQKIDDAGLHYSIDGEDKLLEVDSIVICTGQDSNNALYQELTSAGIECQLIGGASEAKELDALAAVSQGMEVGINL